MFTKLSEKIGTYRMHYEDGTVVEAPLIYGQNVVEWNHRQPEIVAGADIAWKGRTNNGDKVCVFAWKWRNPHPAKLLTSLDIVSFAGESSPIVLAVTGRVIP
jgi:hypothetical protein